MSAPWYVWLFVILAPLACAAAGAGAAWLALRAGIERRLDACWDEAWDACLNSVAAQWQPYAAEALAAASDRAEQASGGAVAATETLAPLPALNHEAGRHERPHRPAWRHEDLAALARVREEFTRIRMDLGLWA